MPLTFNDVYGLYRDTGSSLSLPEFTKKANKLTGTEEFSVGNRSGLGGLISKGNFWVDQAIPESWKAGSASFGGDVFDFFGGNRNVGESVGRELPRQAVNFLPWILGGLATGGVAPAIGLGTTSVLSGAQAYGDTGSPWRAAASAAMPYIGGKVGELAGRGTMNVLGSLAQRAPWLRQLGLEGGREIAEEGGEYVAKVAATLPDRLAMYMGGQVGGQAAMEGLQYGQEAIAQGDLTPSMYEGLTLKDYVLQTALGNAPFAAVDVPSLVRPSVISRKPVEQPVKPVQELPTAQQRDVIEARYTAERAMAEILPDEMEREAALAKAKDQYLLDSYAEDVKRGRIVEPPAFDWSQAGGTPQDSVIGAVPEKPYWMQMAERKAKEQAAKQTVPDPASLLDSKEQAQIAEIRRAETPSPKFEELKTPQQVAEALGTAHNISPVTLEDVRQNVEMQVELGASPDEAMQRATVAVVNEAKPKRVRTRNGFTASETEKQILEWGTLREQEAKTNPQVKEQLGTFEKVLREYSVKARAGDRERISTKMLTAWRNWSLKPEGQKGNLESTLRTVTGNAGDDALVGPSLRGAGGKAQRYAAREDAERRANYLTDSLDEESPIQAYVARKNSDNGQYEIKPRYKSAEAKAEASAAKNAVAKKVAEQMVPEAEPVDVDERLGKQVAMDNFTEFVQRTDSENLIELVTGVNNRLQKRSADAYQSVQETLMLSTRAKSPEELTQILKAGLEKSPVVAREALQELILSRLEESPMLVKEGELDPETIQYVNEALAEENALPGNEDEYLRGAGGGRFTVSDGITTLFSLQDGKPTFAGLDITNPLVPESVFTEAVKLAGVTDKTLNRWKVEAAGAFGKNGVDVEFLRKALTGKLELPKDHIAFRHEPTGSVAEATLVKGDAFGVAGDAYYFNRMGSLVEGEGGGNLVLKQLLDYSDSTGTPIINEPVAKVGGGLTQPQLENWYKSKGFVPIKAGERPLVYHPGTQQMLARSPEAVPSVKNLFGRVLRKSGWTDQQIAATTEFVSGMEQLLPFSDVQVGEVINDVFIKGKPIYGLATASGPSKKLYLSRLETGFENKQQMVKDATFMLAHEAAGHLLQQHYRAGLLSEKQTKALSDMEAFLSKTDAQGQMAPEVKEFFDLWNKEVLPKDLQDGPFVQEMLSSKDPEEMFANLVAGWVHSRLTPERTRAVAMLGPREARGFLHTLADYARRLWGAMKSALFAQSRATPYMGKSIRDVVKELDSVSKAIQKAERDVDGLNRLYDSNQRLWLEPLRTSQLEVIDDNTMLPASTYLGPGDMKDSALRIASRWFEQLHNLGQRIPAAKQATTSLLDHGPTMHRNHVQSLAPIHGSVSPVTGELITRGSQAEKEHKMIQLDNDQKMNQLFSDMMMWNQGKDQISTELSVEKLKVGAPDLYQKVMALPENKRTALMNQVAAHHQSNRVIQDQFVGAQNRKTDYDVAAYLSSKMTSKFDMNDPAQAAQAEQVHQQALKLAQTIVEARRLATSNDPTARMAGEQQLGSVVPVVGGEAFAKAIQLATVRDQNVSKYQEFFAQRQGFMTRMRFGEVLAKAKVNGKDVEVIGLPSPSDRPAWEQAMRSKHGPNVSFGYEPVKHGTARIALPDEFLQIVREAEAKQAEMIRGLGLAPDVVEQMIGAVDIESDLILQQKLGESAVVPGSRKLAPGNLDMVATHAGYQGFMARRNADTVMNARLAYAMSSPGLNRLPAQKEQIRQAVQQYRTPDSGLGRALSLGNAVYYLGANIPAHLTNTLQSYMTAIPEMVSRGYSLAESTKRIAGAHKDIGKFTWNLLTSKIGFGEETKALTKWKDPDERGMLKWAIENGYIGFGQFDDIRNQRTEAAIDLAMARKKGGFGKLADVVTAPVRKFADLSLQAYAATERLNVMTALVAGYRAARDKQGKNFDRAAAREQAVEFMRSVTYQGGRANRPVAPYEGQHKLIGHLAYGLQTYSLGWLGQLARYVQHWRGPEYANLTEGQRKASRNAAMTMLGTQFAAAGALGMPFFGAAVTLLEKALGKDLKGNLYTQLSDLLDSDDESGGGLADAVMTGGANALLSGFGVPLDVGGRFAIGGTPGFNEYEGFSENAVFGPTAGIVGSVLAGLKGAYEGDWKRTAKEFAPNAMKRGIDYWMNGEQIVSSQGVPFEATDGEKLGYQLGFFPTRLKKLRQYQTYSQNAKREQASKYAKDIDELAEYVMSEPGEALEAFEAKLAELDGTKTRRELASDVATRAATKTFPTDVRADARGGQSEYLMGVAKALGVPLPQANQVEQLNFKSQIMSMFGAQPRPSRSQRSRAAAADLLGESYQAFPDQSYGRGSLF